MSVLEVEHMNVVVSYTCGHWVLIHELVGAKWVRMGPRSMCLWHSQWYRISIVSQHESKGDMHGLPSCASVSVFKRVHQSSKRRDP